MSHLCPVGWCIAVYINGDLYTMWSRWEIKSDSQWDQGFRSHVALDVFRAHTCVLREGRRALDDVWGHPTGMFPEVMLVKIKYNKLCFQLFTSTHSRLRLGLGDVPCRRNEGKRWPWTYKGTVSQRMCCTCMAHLESPNKVPGRATFWNRACVWTTTQMPLFPVSAASAMGGIHVGRNIKVGWLCSFL